MVCVTALSMVQFAVGHGSVTVELLEHKLFHCIKPTLKSTGSVTNISCCILLEHIAFYSHDLAGHLSLVQNVTMFCQGMTSLHSLDM